MKKSIYSFLALTVFCLSFSSTNAQDIQNYISSYTGENGKGYMQPLADAFGANFNSGFYHSAEIPKMGINVYVGFVAMTAFISDDSRTFNATTEGFFSPASKVKAPTIFGSTKSLTVDGDAGTQFAFPGGLNIGKLPLAVPQLTVGSFRGTDLTLRFFQINVNDDFGDISLFGVGARHNISQYFVKLPVSLAAGIYYQSFDVGNIIEASAILISGQASYTTSVVTFYGGLGYETSTLNLSYDVGTTENPEKISFDVDAANSVRLTLGAALKLNFFNLHTDYNLGSQSVWAIGFGFSF